MNYQEEWDRALIKAWRDEAKIGQLYYTFCRKVELDRAQGSDINNHIKAPPEGRRLLINTKERDKRTDWKTVK